MLVFVVPWCSSMLAYFAPGDVTVIFGTFAIAAVILGLVLGLSIVSSSHDLQKIPGPPGIPVLGNLLDVGQPQAHQTIAAWAQQWPLYKFKLLWTNNVVVTDPAEIAPLLARGPLELPKAWDIYSPLDPIYSPKRIPSFFTTKNNAMWAAVRKGCAPAFSPDRTRQAFPVVRDTVSTVCDALTEQVARGEASNGVDMAQAALRVALDVFGITGFDHDFRARDYGDCLMLETLPQLLAEFSKRALNPLRTVGHALMPWSRDAAAFRRNLRVAHQLWGEMAREVRGTDVAAAESRGDTSLRVCMAKLKNLVTGELLSEEELLPHVAAFLVAGFETTGHSVAWALYEIALNPQVQSKLADELAGAGLLWAPGQPGRPLEQSDLSTLRYLDQVWREAMRLHSVSTVAPIRQADREVVLRSDLRIPCGTLFWLSAVAVHLSPFNFVDPTRFWPERWDQSERTAGTAGSAGSAGSAGLAGKAGAGEGLDGGGSTDTEDGEVLEKEAPQGKGAAGPAGEPTPSGNSGAPPSRSFMAFSFGPRDCLGQALANLEGKAMLAMLCARFEFEVAPCMGTPEDVRAAEVNRLVMQSGKGVWLLLKPRAGQ